MTDVSDYTEDLRDRPAARTAATFGEIWSSEWTRSGLDTFLGVGRPLFDAQEELGNAVEAAHGKPLGELARERNLSLVGFDARVKSLGDLVDALPEEKRKELEPLKDVRRRAAEKAQTIERDAGDVNAATYGLSGTALTFLAGVARQAVDPVAIAANVVTAPIGGPFKGALLPMLGRQAAAGAVAQTLVEPHIQSVRQELGLEAGPAQGAINIVQSAVGSAGMAGLFRAGAAGIRVARRSLARPTGLAEGEIPTAGASEARPAEITPVEAPQPVAAAVDPQASAAAAGRSELAPEDLAAAAHLVERDQLTDAASVEAKLPIAEHAAAVESAGKAIAAGTPIEVEPIADAPVPSGVLENRAVAIEAATQAGVVPEIAELARAGKTASEISEALEGKFSVDDVRAVRDTLGIEPAGPLMTPGGAQLQHGPKATATPTTIPSPQGGGEPTVPVARLAETPLPKPAAAEPPEIHVTEKKPRGPKARSPDTWSLLEFLVNAGGIRPDDPLIGDVRGSIGSQNKFVPGFGNLIRKGGMTLDQAREAAVEAGYIHDIGAITDAQATSSVRTLLDAVDTELRGTKQYRQGADTTPGKADVAHAKEQELDVIEKEIDAQWAAVDLRPADVPQAIRKRVVEIMQKEGERDAVTAFDRAILESEEADARIAAVRHDEIPDIPGWDVPADAGAAPADGGAAAPGGSGGERAGAPDATAVRETARAGGGRDRGAGPKGAGEQAAGDPALKADADRVLEEAGGDLEIQIQDPDGSVRKVSAREALIEAEEQERAAAELVDCIGAEPEVPF